MRKKTKFRSLLLDVLVVLLCLSVAGGGFYLFWKDLNSSSSRSDRESVAFISYKYKIAQRKYEDRVVWERISQNSPLYNGDIIRTAELASAVISFDDGTELNLSENTMVQIFYDEVNGLQISVDGGDIQIDSSADSSPVSVRLDDGSVVSVGAGASLAAKSDSSGARNVEVKSGEAQLITESGQSTSLLNGESVSIESGGEIVRNPITVTSVSRDTRILNVAGERRTVTLAWNANAEVGENPTVIVQTSRAKDFSSLDINETIESGSRYTLQTEDSGTTYWRVFTDDTADRPAEGKITVQTVDAVTLTSPSLGGEIFYRTDLPKVNFRWNGNPFADYYRLTVSSTPDLRTSPLVLDATETFISLDSLGEGTWYWQIIPYYSAGSAGFTGGSEISSFRIVRNEVIAPPMLSIPADGAQISYRDSVNATFIWKSDIKDASYELLISRDEAFANILYSETTSSLRVQKEFSTSELPDGTYWWKVVRHSEESDDITPESQSRSFTAARYVPQENKLVYPPQDTVIDESKLSSVGFTWKLGDDYRSPDTVSVIQVSRNSSFSSVVLERTVSGTLLEGLSLGEGSYWWRMGVRKSDGSLEGLTEAWQFKVMGELGIPVITTPSSGSEMIASAGSELEFTWTAVNGADSYNVRVYDADENLVAKNTVRGTSARFALTGGKYILRVQALSSQTGDSPARTGENANRSFTVRAPAAVQLSLPAADAKIDGLKALREATVFSWVTGEDSAPSYEFVLSKQNADGSYRVVERRTVTQQTVSVSRLTEGTYSWKINASTAQGYAIDSSVRTFTVGAVPALASPRLQSPSNNTLMGAAYFKSNRSISFSWRGVSGATSYTFVLYQRASNGSLTAIRTERNIRGTSFEFTDLTKLDVGTFVWQVTAYAYAADGYEEQRSVASSATFKIDFDTPQEVQTVDPGKLYGE